MNSNATYAATVADNTTLRQSIEQEQIIDENRIMFLRKYNPIVYNI